MASFSVAPAAISSAPAFDPAARLKSYKQLKEHKVMLQRRHPKKGKSTRFGWTKAEVEYFGHVLRLDDLEMEQTGVDNVGMQRRFTRGWIERTFQWRTVKISKMVVEREYSRKMRSVACAGCYSRINSSTSSQSSIVAVATVEVRRSGRSVHACTTVLRGTIVVGSVDSARDVSSINIS